MIIIELKLQTWSCIPSGRKTCSLPNHKNGGFNGQAAAMHRNSKSNRKYTKNRNFSQNTSTKKNLSRFESQNVIKKLKGKATATNTEEAVLQLMSFYGDTQERILCSHELIETLKVDLAYIQRMVTEYDDVEFPKLKRLGLPIFCKELLLQQYEYLEALYSLQIKDDC